MHRYNLIHTGIRLVLPEDRLFPRNLDQILKVDFRWSHRPDCQQVYATLPREVSFISILSRASFRVNRYNKPLLISPVNISFAYSLPNFSEFKNFNAVGPIVVTHTNFGSVYLPFPNSYKFVFRCYSSS